MRITSTSPSALTFARLLGEGPMARLALEAALGNIDSAAFIASGSGTVLYANVDGAKKLRRSRDQLRKTLARAIRQLDDATCAGSAVVTILRCEHTEPYFLVIFPASGSLADKIHYAASVWELTRREREVLELVAGGFANKTIAVKLDCAVRTVETHLSSIFRKSGFDGRNTLLAAMAETKPPTSGQRRRGAG